MSVDLIIFDCDGVLVDSELISSRVLARMLTAQGYEITAGQCRDRFTGISFPKVVSLVEADWGRKLPEDFEQRVRAEDFRAYTEELTAVPGVADVLPRLPQTKCVASSGAPEKMRHTLGVTGLIGHFDGHLFSAHQVERGKPAPDLFLFAARAMGIPPEHCVVIEDARAGIRGALAAGMRVLGFAGAGHCGPGYADMLKESGAPAVFDDMRQLPDLLDKEITG